MSKKHSKSPHNAPPEAQKTPPAADQAPTEHEETLAPTQPSEEQRLLEQLQRLQAEFDNFRKRSDADAASAMERGREGAIKELLPVIDSLMLARSHAASAAPNVEELAKGLTLIHNQLDSLLEAWNVKTVPETGTVDPRFHEVYLTETLPDTPAGTITQVLQPGYVRNGVVLRTAKVKAARN
jgi:molecular chaperone GrpE